MNNSKKENLPENVANWVKSNVDVINWIESNVVIVKSPVFDERKPIIDPNTGDINFDFHLASQLEDFVLPERNGVSHWLDGNGGIKNKSKRLFKVEVGNLNSSEEQEYLQQMMKQIKKENLIPFKLFEFQKTLLLNFENSKFNIVKSARQMGVTHLLAAYALYFACKNPNVYIEIRLSKDGQRRKFMGMLRSMIVDLDMFITIDNNEKLIFDESNSSINLVLTPSHEAKIDLLISDNYDEMFCHFAGMNKVILARTEEPEHEAKSPFFLHKDTIVNFGEFYNESVIGKTLFKPTLLTWDLHPWRDTEWAKGQIEKLGVSTFINQFGANPPEIDRSLDSQTLYLYEETSKATNKTDGFMSEGSGDPRTCNLLIGDKVIARNIDIVDRETFLYVIKWYNKLFVGI